MISVMQVWLTATKVAKIQVYLGNLESGDL